MSNEADALLEDPLESIGTRRLVLRALLDGDAAPMAALANDRAVADMVQRLPHPYTIADAHAFLSVAEQEIVYAVTRACDGAFMGICGLRATPKPRAADLGYWLGREFWGRGYATEAAHAAIDLAFTTLDIECVWANCRVINRASQRVLEKCGFQHRGTGLFTSAAAGRVASEDFHLDRGAWMSLKAWGRE